MGSDAAAQAVSRPERPERPVEVAPVPVDGVSEAVSARVEAMEDAPRPIHQPESAITTCLEVAPIPAPGVSEAVLARVEAMEDAPRPIRRPESATTTSLAGEGLAEVAARVYGSTDAVEILWRANRDQIDNPDAPIRTGALLRTP